MQRRIKESASLVFAGAALVWVAGCAAPSQSPDPAQQDSVIAPEGGVGGNGGVGNGGNGGAG
jgi:hypothetical protein